MLGNACTQLGIPLTSTSHFSFPKCRVKYFSILSVAFDICRTFLALAKELWIGRLARVRMLRYLRFVSGLENLNLRHVKVNLSRRNLLRGEGTSKVPTRVMLDEIVNGCVNVYLKYKYFRNYKNYTKHRSFALKIRGDNELCRTIAAYSVIFKEL